MRRTKEQVVVPIDVDSCSSRMSGEYGNVIYYLNRHVDQVYTFLEGLKLCYRSICAPMNSLGVSPQPSIELAKPMNRSKHAPTSKIDSAVLLKRY